MSLNFLSSRDIVRLQRWELARARASRFLDKSRHDDYVSRYYGENPGERDEGGKFSAGGGSGSGDQRPDATGTGSGASSARKPSASYSRRSPSDAERSRDVAAVFEPTADSRAALERAGITPLTYEQLSPGAAGAQRFHDAIAAAKAGKYGASVTAYPVEEYADMKTFLTPDGQGGFALNGDDVISVFKNPASGAKGFASTALSLATAQGGKRLDAFDTALPDLYSDNGFRTVARIPWNDEYSPADWSKETFKGYNAGRPDVVFMVHDPANAKPYRKGDGPRVADYDAGIAAQRAALASIKALLVVVQRYRPEPTSSTILRQRLALERERFERARDEQPRVPAGSPEGGQFGSGGGGRTSGDGAKPGSGKPPPTGVKLKKTNERAWGGKPNADATRLGKLEAGDLGERIAQEYVRSLGREFANTQPLNVTKTNFPVDMIGDHELYEVKTGQVSNSSAAQQWRATIGQPGKAESEWLKKAAPEAKKAHNAGKQKAILDRKQAILKEYSKKVGRKLGGKTITSIIDPDRGIADLYVFDGFHNRIGWTSDAAKKSYIGSFKYSKAATRALETYVIKIAQEVDVEDADVANAGAKSSPAPQFVWDEFLAWLDEYDQSLREGLDEYFDLKPEKSACADCGPPIDGWFVARDGSLYALIEGHRYKVECEGGIKPGWYTNEQLEREIAAQRERYYGENPGERDEAGKFSAGGGGGGTAESGAGGSAAHAPKIPKPVLAKPPAGSKHPGEGYSKESYVDSKGVIHTSNVDDAHLALHEGKKVSLDQPRTLSTLMDKLGAVAKDMKAKGQEAPNYDLCNVSVKGTNLFCSESHGIPRAEMPQLPPGKENDFLDMLKSEGHGVERTTEHPAYLRATQNELNGAKIAGMMDWIRKDNPQREIVVSKDNYVLDGHHFWAAQVGVAAASNKLDAGTKMPVARVDINITDLLDAANRFTEGKGKVGVYEHRPTDVRTWASVFNIDRVNRIFGHATIRTILRQRLALERERFERALRYYGENPGERDEGGRFGPGGGSGSSADDATGPPRPTGGGKKPKVTGVQTFELVTNKPLEPSAGAVAKANNAVNAIPESHQQELANVPVKVLYANQVPGRGVYAGEGEIAVNENMGRYARDPVTGSMGELKYVPIESVERTAVHELGHAYDHKTNWKAGRQITNAVNRAKKEMTTDEIANAKYFLSSPKERFAELYALAYSPDMNTHYFNMPRDRAMEVMGDAIAKLRAMDAPSTIKALDERFEEKPESLLNNGWFVTTDGVVYAIVNGSAYEVDAGDMVNLPPGDYTDEEVDAALARLRPRTAARARYSASRLIRRQRLALERQRFAQRERYYGENPGERDEAGKFSAGGGGGGASDAPPTLGPAPGAKPMPTSKPASANKPNGSGADQVQPASQALKPTAGVSPKPVEQIVLGPGAGGAGSAAEMATSGGARPVDQTYSATAQPSSAVGERLRESIAQTIAQGNQNAPGASDRVSTAQPSEKAMETQGLGDITQRSDITPSYENMKTDPAMLGKVADLIRDKYAGTGREGLAGYPPFMRLLEGFDDLPDDQKAEALTDAFVNQAASNLVALYDAQTEQLGADIQDRSTRWYEGANKIANDLAKKFGIEPRQAAGAIACMSPQRDWDQNVELAERVIEQVMRKETLPDGRTVPLKDVPFSGDRLARTKAEINAHATRLIEEDNKKLQTSINNMVRKDPEGNAKKINAARLKIQANIEGAAEFRKLADRIEGQSLSQMSVKDQPQVVRFASQAERPNTSGTPIWNPEGTPSGDVLRNKPTPAQERDKQPGTPSRLQWGGFDDIGNAMQCLRDPSMANMSNSVGSMHKVRNFYNNIVSPDFGVDTTIDTHAVAAATLMPLGGTHPLVASGLGMTGKGDPAPGSASTGQNGLYALYNEAYRIAAAEISARPGGRTILPRQMQSATWETLRGLYSDTDKRSAAIINDNRAVWSDYSSGRIDLGTAQQRLLAKRIEPPRWATPRA